MPIDSMVIALTGNAFAQTDNASITTNYTITKGTASAIDDDDIKSISSCTNLTLNLGNPFLIENDSRTAKEAKIVQDDMKGQLL